MLGSRGNLLPRTRHAAILLLLCFLGTIRSSHGQETDPDGPMANPGRPTVSTPATITPIDYLQCETGFLGAKHSPEFSSRSSVNEVLKFSVSHRLELLASAEPIVHYSTDNRTANGTAELFIGAQAVVRHGEGSQPTIAVSYLRRVFDGGAPELDLGSARNSLILLASADVKHFHYDTNAMFNEVIQGDVHRAQFAQTLSVSHLAGKKFAISGELWHFTQPFLRSNAVGNLWALSYTARPNLVFDGGFNRGLTSTSTRWEVFLGFTYLLPRKLLH
jgi:hypothetical protein